MSGANVFSGCDKILDNFLQVEVSCQLYRRLLLLRPAFRTGPGNGGHHFQAILTIAMATRGYADGRLEKVQTQRAF